MTISSDALQAINARQQGIFDDPCLMAVGPLSTVREDVQRIKQRALSAIGAIVGRRDYRLNRNFVGRFMVAEAYDDDETPTDDGANGPWCIVGDNLDDLIEEAFDVLVCDIYREV